MEPPDVVTFNAEEASFCILNPAKFAKEVLPRYFKHNKLGSFSQQLHTYGFRRKTAASSLDSAVEFYHDQYQGDSVGFLNWVRSGGATSKRTGNPREAAAGAPPQLIDDMIAVHEGTKHLALMFGQVRSPPLPSLPDAPRAAASPAPPPPPLTRPLPHPPPGEAMRAIRLRTSDQAHAPRPPRARECRVHLVAAARHADDAARRRRQRRAAAAARRRRRAERPRRRRPAAAAAAGYGAGAPAAAHAMPPPVDFGASGFRVGSRSLEGLHFQAHLDALEAGIGPNADVSTMLPGSASLDNALGVGVGSLDGDALQMFADSCTNFVDNTSGRLSVGNLPVGNNGSFSVDNRTPAPYPVNAGIPQQPAGEVKVDSQP